MKQVRMRYSKEFKIKAVEMSHSGVSTREVSEQLKITPETLRLWKKAYREGKLRLDSEAPERQKSKEEEELTRLRKELYEVTLERDILKKAVGIFSKNGR
jgi:transposase